MVHPRLQDQRSHGITTGARRATASRVNVTSTLGHDARMTVWIDTHCHLDAPEFFKAAGAAVLLDVLHFGRALRIKFWGERYRRRFGMPVVCLPYEAGVEMVCRKAAARAAIRLVLAWVRGSTSGRAFAEYAAPARY